MNASVQLDQHQEPPREVRAAIYLMGVLFALTVVRSAIGGRNLISTMLAVICIVLIAYLWLKGLSRGKNWLWWFTVISGIPSCLTAPLSVPLFDPIQAWLYWMQVLMHAPALVLLLLPKARAWYK
jgi:type IV secretory pathway VirB2 component (pilin)